MTDSTGISPDAVLPRPPVWPRFAVSFAILGGWLACHAVGDAFAVLVEHWPVALTMVFGSFVAGATAEGGGAVAFPVFTKALAIPPATARDFALAIQSVGMTCGALLIARSGYRYLADVFAWTLAGAAPAVIFGLAWVAPLVVPPYPKIFFSLFTLVFGGFLVWLNWGHHRALREAVDCRSWGTRGQFILTGLVGGLVASIVGSGADVVLFILLCLRYDLDEKIGTRTTVFVMASVSLVGFAFSLVTGRLDPRVLPMWQAAVPVVAFGAPLGALFCSWQKREHVVAFLIGLILLEFVTTLWLEPIDRRIALFSLAFLLLSSLVMAWLRWCRYRPTEEESAS